MNGEKRRLGVGKYEVDYRRFAPVTPAPVMLLIHGIGVSGRYFTPFAKVAGRHYDVHVLDLPGYGETRKPKKPLAPYELAEVAAEYLRAQGIKTAVVVGQSMGCQTAAHLAAVHPELCNKLVLIGPTVNKAERNLFLQGVRLFQDTLREPFAANKIVFSDYARMGVTRYLATANYMVADHIEETLAKVQAEVLLVRGAKDAIAPKPWLIYLAGQAAQAKVTEIADAPHLVQFVKPKELFRACERFLNE